jgi:hypothetical protein
MAMNGVTHLVVQLVKNLQQILDTLCAMLIYGLRFLARVTEEKITDLEQAAFGPFMPSN